jgi:polyhydroxyalkanoate synthesis regulator phasin
VSEAFQTYINMVTGVTRSTQAKASATARALFKQAGLEDVAVEASERAAKLAEEIMNASRINRELLQHFVTAEVDKAAGRLGFARAEEVEALRAEVASLRSQLDEAVARTAQSAPARKAAAKKSPSRKASPTTTPTKKATAAKSASGKPVRKSAATAKRTKPSGEK